MASHADVVPKETHWFGHWSDERLGFRELQPEHALQHARQFGLLLDGDISGPFELIGARRCRHQMMKSSAYRTDTSTGVRRRRSALRVLLAALRTLGASTEAVAWADCIDRRGYTNRSYRSSSTANAMLASSGDKIPP